MQDTKALRLNKWATSKEATLKHWHKTNTKKDNTERIKTIVWQSIVSGWHTFLKVLVSGSMEERCAKRKSNLLQFCHTKFITKCIDVKWPA